jgi:dolichol-phosphate mannosyltransferase
MSGKTLVAIGTYNERENIARLVEQVLSVAGREPLDILIADDNSPDGTGHIADELSKRHARVHVLHGPHKRGLGRAYLAAFAWALSKGYDTIITMDADFSHDPNYLPEMLTKSREYDVVIASRYVPGGGVKNWPWYRRVVSRGGSIYSRLVTGLPVRDATGGFNCYARSVLQSIGLETIQSEGYAFMIEMKFRAWKKGFRLCEVPIVFVDRTLGASKMSKRIFLEAFFRCLQLRLSH